jgi:hypothetical protein
MKLLIGAVLTALILTVVLPAEVVGSEETHPPHTKASAKIEKVFCIDDLESCTQSDSIWAVGNVAADREVDRVNAYFAILDFQRGLEEEAARQAEAAAAAARSRGRSSGRSSASISVECGNTLLPGYIVQRESSGDCNAFNATGCGGRGCIGYAQLDQGHFSPVSPWNPNVPGSCYGLSYNECVHKISGGGSNLDPWAATR